MNSFKPWRQMVAAMALVASSTAIGGELDVHLGPPALGNGGTNPVSIPPVNPVEYEVEYATNNDWETCIAIVPGIFVGHRNRLPAGLYVSTGGGLVLDANGVGPGVYAAAGLSVGKGAKFNMEFKQAVGYNLGRAGLISPYALRLGVGFDL